MNLLCYTENVLRSYELQRRMYNSHDFLAILGLQTDLTESNSCIHKQHGPKTGYFYPFH
jgi:hypothetical protein